MEREIEIKLRVNGRDLAARAEPRMTLGDFLRDRLGLTGTHLGCEHGVCGACTVLLDGASVRSCLMFAVQAQGRDLTTVEGVADPTGDLDEIQEAFAAKHGLQCGYCTPGLILTTRELLADEARPEREQIKEYLSGNLCRCTGYLKILEAVDYAAQLRRQEPEPEAAASEGGRARP